MLKLSDKQERFCKEYIIDCNATQAYIRAGYSPKGANALASRLMSKDSILARVRELMAAKDDELIAKGDEVLKQLTAMMRGVHADGRKLVDDVPLVVGIGKGYSEIQHTTVEVSARERIKAAELLGKRYGLFTDNLSVDMATPIIIDSVAAQGATSPPDPTNPPKETPND